MTATRTLIFPDHVTLSQAVALFFAESAKEAIDLRGRFLVSLCGGDTPLLLFEILGSSPYRDYLPWQNIHLFWGDERCVPPDDPDSNYGQAWQSWLKHVSIPAKNIHRIQGELEPSQAADRYQDELKVFADQGQAWPHMDWSLLGLGENGHTASLFPGSAPLPDLNRAVVAVHNLALGRLAHRISLTPVLFNLSRQVIFMVSGQRKAHALAASQSKLSDPFHWPAQQIHPEHGLLVWMVDEAATSGRSFKEKE